jgi:hypothetical protein
LNETNDGVVENEDDAFEENELLDDDIQVKAEKSEFMVILNICLFWRKLKPI